MSAENKPNLDENEKQYHSAILIEDQADREAKEKKEEETTPGAGAGTGSASTVTAPIRKKRDKGKHAQSANVDVDGPFYQVEKPYARVCLDHQVAASNENGKKIAAYTLYCIDISGSMSGGPWRQMKEAITYIRDNSPADSPPEFVLYDSGAQRATANDALATTPRFRTSFRAAFSAIGQYVMEKPEFSNVAIVFLTDGEETVQTPIQLTDTVDKFDEKLKKCRRNVVIHTVGFSRDHDREFLLRLNSLGAGGGAYRYAEGSSGLDVSFAECFDFLATTRRLKVRVGTMRTDVDVDAEIIRPGVLRVDILVDLQDVGIENGDDDDDENKLRVDVMDAGKEIKTTHLTRRDSDVFMQLKIIEAAPIKTEAQLNRAQTMLSYINPMRVPKLDREKAVDERQSVQERLDSYHALFAEAAHGGLPEDSVTSRLEALRYQAQFSKARRRRKMDIRARNNASRMDTIAIQLDSLKPDLDQFEEMELTCPLSGLTAYDVMADGPSDIMVFPLRVQRPEHAVDAPSQVVVYDVLHGTYSFESLQDSMAFALRTQAPEQAHGGFGSVAEDTGMFRGPDGKYMNACLPLYLNDDHFKRVEAQIEPILGYFFTLDPLGFKSDQYLALFNILGSMLTLRKNGVFVSEYADFVIDDFTKLCKALSGRVLKMLSDGEYGNGVLRIDPIEAFVSGPKYRTKEVFQSLFILIGWYHSVTKTADLDTQLEERFFDALTEELWRRSFGLHYKEAPRELVLETLERLIYGPENENVEEEVETEVEGSSSGSGSGSGSDTKTINSIKSEMKRQKEEDELYATYAEYQLGLMSKTQLKKLGGAKPRVPPALVRMNPNIDTADADDENGNANEDEVSLLLEGYEPRKMVQYEDASDEVQAYFDHISAVEIGKISTMPLVQNVSHLIDREYVGAKRRRMVIQALQYYSNTLVNSAVSHDPPTYVDTTSPATTEIEIMQLAHNGFEKRRREIAAAGNTDAQVFEVAKRIARTKNVMSFVGRLLMECSTRGGPVFDQFSRLLGSGSVDGGKIPILRTKIRALLTGKLSIQEEVHNVISNGVPWTNCPINLAEALKNAYGDVDEFAMLEASMHGRYGHVYRFSDIPNRHGFCNSHPNPNLVWTFNGFFDNKGK